MLASVSLSEAVALLLFIVAAAFTVYAISR